MMARSRLASLALLALSFRRALSTQCSQCALQLGSSQLMFNATCSQVAALVQVGDMTCDDVTASDCSCCNFCLTEDLKQHYNVYKNCSQGPLLRDAPIARAAPSLTPPAALS